MAQIPARWITNLGTRMAESTPQTSISPLNRYQASAEPGLVEYRRTRANQGRNAGLRGLRPRAAGAVLL
jgi:hypothetical protein